MSVPDSPTVLDSSIPDWVRWDFRQAWARRSWQKVELQKGRAKRLSCSLVGICHGSPQLGLHPHSGHSAHEFLLFEKSTTCLVSGTERHPPGQKWENQESWWGSAGSSASWAALPSEMVPSLMPLHPLWTQPAPPAGGTGKAGSCLLSCGLLSSENRLKLFFFRAVLWGAGREHPDRALRINFINVSPSDKMFELCQFLYVLSHWLRTALSWIGKWEQCKSTDVWHLPVFWLREREINKSCQRNALE